MKPNYSQMLCVMAALVVGACNSGSNDVQEVSTAAPVETMAEVPKYSAEAFFATTSYGIVGASAHAFSADGSALLISSDDTGVFNAYSLPLAGGEPAQLTMSDDNAVFAVSWFPKDDRILYTYDGGGNELNHVVVREEDGSSKDLTPGDAVKAGFVGWNSDGGSFYLVTTERNEQSFDLYQYSSEDYSRELIYEKPRISD